MRHFIKKKWFPLIIGVMILLLVGVIMALLGFRITYAPELETSWEAVSAVAAWAGAIGTVAAVFSAIYVANRQNKFALFEKRYVIYKIILDCKTFYKLLQITDNIEAIRMRFLSVFSMKTILDEAVEEKLSTGTECLHQKYKNNLRLISSTKCKEVLDLLNEAVFLFANDSDIIAYTQAIADSLFKLVILEEKNNEEALRNFFKAVDGNWESEPKEKLSSENKGEKILRKIKRKLEL